MTALTPSDIITELDRLESLRDPTRANISQRLFERTPLRGQCELTPIDRNRVNLENIEVHLRDISLGGIGFVAAEPLAPGLAWQCHFLHNNYPVAEQAIIVRHCKRIASGAYLCGGQFIANPGLLSVLGCSASFIRKQYDAGDDHPMDGYFTSVE